MLLLFALPLAVPDSEQGRGWRWCCDGVLVWCILEDTGGVCGRREEAVPEPTCGHCFLPVLLLLVGEGGRVLVIHDSE